MTTLTRLLTVKSARKVLRDGTKLVSSFVMREDFRAQANYCNRSEVTTPILDQIPDGDNSFLQLERKKSGRLWRKNGRVGIQTHDDLFNERLVHQLDHRGAVVSPVPGWAKFRSFWPNFHQDLLHTSAYNITGDTAVFVHSRSFDCSPLPAEITNHRNFLFLPSSKHPETCCAC